MKKHITKRPKGFALALGTPGLLVVIIPVIIAILVPSMLGYVKKSKTQTSNSNAKTVMVAANTALTELYEDDFKLSGDYIISSDESKNVNVPFDVDEFYEKAEYYYYDMSDIDYFIIVEDGYCSDVAVIDDSGYVGTYGSYFGYNSGKNFNELYEEAVDYIS